VFRKEEFCAFFDGEREFCSPGARQSDALRRFRAEKAGQPTLRLLVPFPPGQWEAELNLNACREARLLSAPGNVEAGTGIEPVFTDLQSDKILNYVNTLR